MYGILGSYAALGRFAAKLCQVKMPNGEFFPSAVSVNRGILNSIPDAEFKTLAENEPRRPEPTMARVAQAFAAFLRSELNKKDLIVLSGLEMIFIYNVELNLLRTMATDNKRVILLLPGKRTGVKYSCTWIPAPVNTNYPAIYWRITTYGGDRSRCQIAVIYFPTASHSGRYVKYPKNNISVLIEQHIWADCNAPEARKARKPEIQTIEEFQIDPVRPFLNDILRNMAAPYKREKKDNPIGQGYWIQAEFGSGKSHLLCFLASLALGNQEAWDIVKTKEQKAGRGKRESIYRFWEDGLQAKSTKGNRGIFVVARTLVGAGGGTVGLVDKGKRLSVYILEAVKEQLQLELGKNLSLYPVELLADRFLTEDLDHVKT